MSSTFMGQGLQMIVGNDQSLVTSNGSKFLCATGRTWRGRHTTSRTRHFWQVTYLALSCEATGTDIRTRTCHQFYGLRRLNLQHMPQRSALTLPAPDVHAIRSVQTLANKHSGITFCLTYSHTVLVWSDMLMSSPCISVRRPPQSPAESPTCDTSLDNRLVVYKCQLHQKTETETKITFCLKTETDQL